jgi:sulfur-oxidizing protein SoxY
MNIRRRLFLRRSLITSSTLLAMGTGLIRVGSAVAAWPRAAFEARSTAQAMQLLFGTQTAEERLDIRLKIRPAIDHGGTEIFVMVTANIEQAESITLFIANAPSPLAASHLLGEETECFISTRLKMEQSGDVTAIIKTKDRLFSTTRSVDMAGCGCA